MDQLQVEFVAEPGTALPQAKRPSLRAVIAVAAILVAGAIVAVMRTATVVEAGRPSAGLHCSCDPEPSAAIQAVFAEHLPGSVVVDESTETVPGQGHTLRRRALRVVYGNVVITVIISLASSTSPIAQDVGLIQNGYFIHFGFNGYYPPTSAQLTAVADDARLLAV